ncbi:MAG: MotB family protein [Rhizobiaceae bacterium]|jgi:chemotaxis protein MotB|nr:MotB family protein [Rhizobiaceae bacterium]
MDNAGGQQPIIIIKRKRGGHHDGHHGGVWKIAYADFVTAMMAFFLVMWLINASNEETKAAVASYFNPVKLMDTTANPKGVKDAEYGASSEDTPAKAGDPRAKSSDKQTDSAPSAEGEAGPTVDESVFRDPYAVLAEIAGGKGSGPDADGGDRTGMDDAVPRPGLRGGEAFRDPFEPEFWAERRSAEPAASAADAKTQTPPPDAPQPMPQPEATPKAALEDAGDAAALAAAAMGNAAAGAPVAGMPPVPDKAEARADEDDSATRAMTEALRDEIGGGQVSVTAGDGSVIIDMTDGESFAMFELGSARPEREVVLMMERIAAALKDKPGMIEISGHTDARPFRGDAYDNWRLSSARAQMAYYMLVRAGIPENRIRAVTGHADRLPKNADDPLAAENRRISIRLVQDEAGAP